MGIENWSGARYWEGSEGADIAAATKALTASITPFVVGKFADVTARNSAAAALLAQPEITTLEGLTCYVTARKGYCFHNGTTWKWLPQFNSVAGAYQAAGVNSASTTSGLVLATDAFTLTGGNRLVQISASGVVTNLSGSTHNVGRLLLNGGGVPDGGNWMEASVAPGREASVSRQWFQVMSGANTLTLRGLAVSDASGVSFTHTYIQAFDIGPFD